MNAITCDDLVFRRGDRTVLNRIGFELAPGRLLGLIGHNGAGKSTLIKLILGLLKPASGRLEVLGGAPGASPLDVGYLPENVSFYDAMTVEEHLRYFASLKGVARPRIDELVEELGLGVVLRQRLGQCSKGQRQRLGLAQALLTRPRLLMLDEPTDHLDMESITALNNGLIKFPGVLLFTSRDHQIVQTTANRIMEIVPGGKLIDKITTYDEYLESDEMARKRQTYTVETEEED